MVAKATRRFMRVAPSKVDKTRSVDIRITDMGASDALWWDSKLAPKQLALSTRADRYWSWSVLLPMCQLVQLAKRRHCRPLVIWARTDSGRFLRSGMSILIERYPYLDVSAPAESEFLWFISAADPDILRDDFGMSHPPALGRVMLDIAIVLSQNAGDDGRIGLHAAAAGGPALVALYRACGLTNLPQAAALPSIVHRSNDGRFFYADPDQAEALAVLLDPRR